MMDKIKVKFVYPKHFEPQTKVFELNKIELNALMMSDKVTSEGLCFLIRDKIFEDGPEGVSVTIIIR